MVLAASLRRRESGQASVTYLLATATSMVIFVLMANLLIFLYARGVVRAAVDEGARAGAVANASGVECEARAADVLSDLLGGKLGDGIAVSCAVVGPELVATATVVLDSPYPGLGTWNFTAEARAIDESLVVP